MNTQTALYLIAALSMFLSVFFFLMGNAADRKRRENRNAYKRHVEEYLKNKFG